MSFEVTHLTGRSRSTTADVTVKVSRRRTSYLGVVEGQGSRLPLYPLHGCPDEERRLLRDEVSQVQVS